MRDVPGEKPLLPVLGRPMIDRVLDAVLAAEGIGTAVVSVSANTPLTERHLRERGVEVIVTSGRDYCEDLDKAMSRLGSQRVLVLPADLPLLTADVIAEVLIESARSPAGSFCVTVPVETMERLGLHLTYSLEVLGRKVVLCGVSVVDREKMLTGEELEQDYMVSDRVELALNINTRDDLHRAEQLLRRSKKI